jgi:integrase
VQPAKVPAFEEVAERWFQTKTHRRPSHVCDLRQRLDKHILPRFGKVRMDRISVAQIEKFRDELVKAGYAYRTINVVLRVMSSVFRLAIKHGDFTRNPLELVDRATPAAKEVKPGQEAADSVRDAVDPDNVLSPDEIKRLLESSTPGFERTLFETAYVTGAREGELLALVWSDLELPKQGPGRMTIRRTLSWAHLKDEAERPRFFPPKTKAGRRAISLPEILVVDLKRWKLQCPPSGEDLVFPDTNGSPLKREKMLRVHFRPTLSRAHLHRVTFHTLRHSCASALIAAGAPITEVQHRLGHASPAITLHVYSHFMKETESGAADRLADLIQSAVPRGGRAGKSSWATARI